MILAFGMRLPGLGSFMTVDEENWTIRSADFYHKLFQEHLLVGTFLTTHPGVTTMWIAGSGIIFQEARVGFDVDTSNLEYFRLAATLPIVIVTSVLVGLVVYLAVLLWGKAAGFWIGLLLAVDPYVVGMGQIVHLDMLLSLFMVIAVLTFWLYERDRRLLYLVLTGLFSGLALATKLLPALWLFVFFGLFLLWSYRLRFSKVISRLGFIIGLGVVVIWAIWPVLWLQDDVGRSFQRDIPLVITQEHVAIEVSEDPIEPTTFYVRALLGRTMPFVLILGISYVAFRLWHVVRHHRLELSHLDWMLIYGVGFLVLITFVAKKADRYALPALVAFQVLVGLAMGAVLNSHLPTRVSMFKRREYRYGIGLVLSSLLILQVLLWSPYAIAYSSPLFSAVRPFSQQGWGEGLDDAAAWLNRHPLGEDLMVASWYQGVMRTYFNGRTMSLSSRDDDRVGYVVTYRNMRGRGLDDMATNVLEEFADQEPVYVVSIMGLEYAWIYDVIGLPYFDVHVGELVGEMEVGQTVEVDHADWSAIDIGMSNFSGRHNTADVTLHIREDVNAAEDMRAVTINASDVIDSDWNTFAFEPISDSQGKTYYVALTSSGSVPGDAVTVRFSDVDIRAGQMLLRRRALRDGEMNDQFLRDGDVAYRL